MNKINPRNFVTQMQPVFKNTDATAFEVEWTFAPFRYGHHVYMTNRHMTLRMTELDYMRDVLNAKSVLLEYDPCFHREGIYNTLDKLLAPAETLAVDRLNEQQIKTLAMHQDCPVCNGSGESLPYDPDPEPMNGCGCCAGTGLGSAKHTITLQSGKESGTWAATYVAAMMRAIKNPQLGMTEPRPNGLRLLIVSSASTSALGCIANINTPQAANS